MFFDALELVAEASALWVSFVHLFWRLCTLVGILGRGLRVGHGGYLQLLAVLYDLGTIQLSLAGR